MFKCLKGCVYAALSFILLSITAPLAWAFDPTLVIAGTQAMSGMMNSMDKVDEMADLGFALEDLLSELGIDNQGDEEMKRSIRRLEDLNYKARELQWSKEDLKLMLEHDLSQANSFTDKLKAIKNMISASKRIAAIMGVRPKAGDKAAKIQEIRINSMILEELQNIRRAQFLAYLEDREAKATREIFMQEIIEKEKPQFDARALDRRQRKSL